MMIKTVQKVRFEEKFASLAKIGEMVFHSKDLANLWHISNANTLHTTLKRYVQKGLLFRIYKGVYSLKPLGELDPVSLGVKALHEYAYVSCETVLSRAGIIQQSIPFITLVSAKSKQFTIGEWKYRSRKLSDQYLYNPVGIIEQGGVKIATPERAVADLLYFNPRAYLDASFTIKWKKVSEIQRAVGYPMRR